MIANFSALKFSSICLGINLCLAFPVCFGAAAEVDFLREVRPLLSQHCFACHGPDANTRQADLRIDQPESFISRQPGDPKAVVPHSPEQSELIRRILATDGDEVMPPQDAKNPLSDEEQQVLVRWVQQGAAWQESWAYVAPKRSSPTLPTPAENAPQARNWIDAYIAEVLRERGFHMSSRADTVTLLRRISFDLLGLPPSLDDVRRFSDGDVERRIDTYVEELLATPEFGERLASYWLDLVRYADTVGYHGDQDHNISPYRDFVIDSFNDNKPFDQFTIEQIAGDLLPNPSDEQLIATGYNRLLQTSHEGGVQPEEYLAIYAADRVRNLSAVWMGATVGCAQCHDHKYDPYTAKDFYALAAFFADIDEAQHFKVGGNSIPTNRPPESAFLDRRDKQLLEFRKRQILNLNRHSRGSSQSSSKDRDSSVDLHTHTDKSPTTDSAYLRELMEEADAIRNSARACMITVSIAPRTIRVLPRGNWLDHSGPVVVPAIPEFLGSLSKPVQRLSRLDLAKWLVDHEQGNGYFTARVMVNRLWMLMFGQGLSRSVDDFGGQGQPPSHPDLLDRLAIEFVDSGWDVKHMLRLIASSAAYRQSSLETQWHRLHDPNNVLLARQNRYRISAEMIRDTALVCGGLLVREVGGPSAKPYQPPGYYRHLNFPTREYESSSDHQQWRRGVYTHWQRQFLHPMLRAFDAPTREECTAQRNASNTPLAALVWLNDPSLVEAAVGLAHRVIGREGKDDTRISYMFSIATSRLPDNQETISLLALLDSARQEFETKPYAADTLVSTGISGSMRRGVTHATGTIHSADTAKAQGDRYERKVNNAEWAAWTQVARAILNLSETYNRN
ncbi:MAG: PSD1 domain-containing protein [Planctomycetales bacterium]|nr:PSD1 domain-containing protein [Planctomycetales bacterium]